MMKLQKNNKGQYTVTLPVSVVRAKGWRKGDELSVKIDERGRIVLS